MVLVKQRKRLPKKRFLLPALIDRTDEKGLKQRQSITRR
jgi:hypothetical protein